VCTEWHTDYLMNKNSKDSAIREYKYRVQQMSSNPVQKISLAFWVAITILQGAAISPFKEFNGLDDSYFWLISQSAKNLSIIKGEQFLTMGPLGFLDLADPTWHLGYSLSVLFKLFTALILWAGINQRLNLVYKNYNIKYISTTVIVTFFSLVNPTSINLAIGFFLYKHKNRTLEIFSWASVLNILFFVKFLPFVLCACLYGIRSDLYRHILKILFCTFVIISLYTSVVGVTDLYQMLSGSHQTLIGYGAVSSDSSSNLNHYIYFTLFVIIIWRNTSKEFNIIQKLSLASLLFVIFKYGFTRHDVFHVIITFTVLLTMHIYLLSMKLQKTSSKFNKTVRLITFITLSVFVFFSIHGEKILSLSKYVLFILILLIFLAIYHRDQINRYSYFKYYLIMIVATFAISGITPLNPIMPTVIKSSPFSIKERIEWSINSIFSLNSSDGYFLEQKYVRNKEVRSLNEFITQNDLKGNYILMNYSIPLRTNIDLVEVRPPVNPVGAFTSDLDTKNLNWIISTDVDWIFFDGSGIDPIQLLNLSPKFFKYIACNFSYRYFDDSYLVLSKNAEDKCSNLKTIYLDFGGNYYKSYDTESFVYIKQSSKQPMGEDLIKMIFKPLYSLHVNDHRISLRNEVKGDLIRLPNQIDFPDKYSLNGDTLTSLSIDTRFVFGK